MKRLAVAMLAFALSAAACAGEPEVLSGSERNPTPSVSGVTLPEVTNDGSPFSFEATEPNGLMVVYFGFTNCPDICPTTLADLRTALDELDPDQRDRIETAMVTVDPDRDTADILPGYIRSFLPEAAALRSDSPDELEMVAQSFGVTYKVQETDDGIEVIHTGFLYAIDANGDMLITWPFGITPEDLSKDLSILLGRMTT